MWPWRVKMPTQNLLRFLLLLMLIMRIVLPTWSSSSTSATTSISFELASSHTRVTSIKFTKRYGVSEWVSELVSDKHSQWSDSGPIKRNKIVHQKLKVSTLFRKTLAHCLIKPGNLGWNQFGQVAKMRNAGAEKLDTGANWKTANANVGRRQSNQRR